jgi:hypothetical protein
MPPTRLRLASESAPIRALRLACALVIACGALLAGCRDAARRAGEQSDARVNTMRLADFPDGPLVAPEPLARIFVTPSRVDFETGALAAALDDASARSAALSFGTRSLPATALDDDDGDPAPALVAATNGLVASARRFAPSGRGGRGLDVYIEASVQWYTAKRVLQQAALSGFGTFGFGVRSQGAPAVLVYRLPPRSAFGASDDHLKIQITADALRVGTSAIDMREIVRTGPDARAPLVLLRTALRELRAPHPGIHVVWLQPDAAVTFGEVIQAMATVYEDWGVGRAQQALNHASVDVWLM